MLKQLCVTAPVAEFQGITYNCSCSHFQSQKNVLLYSNACTCIYVCGVHVYEHVRHVENLHGPLNIRYHQTISAEQDIYINSQFDRLLTP